MGGFKWWSNHLECGFEMIKMGASENRRSLLPIIYGTSMKEIMVNHWMLGYHMFEPQMPRRLGEATKWGVFCCQTNAKAHSGEKNGTWLQVQVFPAGCLYVVSQLLDTYLSTKNFASRGCELTSPKRHCSPSVRNSLHTSPQTLAQASIRNDFENRGLQNRCNSILYLPVLPPFKWPGLEKPIFCGTLEEKSPESAFRACSHLWAKLLFKAASICCHLCGIFPKLDAFPHHQKGHLGSTSTIFNTPISFNVQIQSITKLQSVLSDIHRVFYLQKQKSDKLAGCKTPGRSKKRWDSDSQHFSNPLTFSNSQSYRAVIVDKSSCCDHGGSGSDQIDPRLSLMALMVISVVCV